MLKEKLQIYCREYARTHNGTAAAKAAGYGIKADGSYNAKTAGQAAFRLMKDPEVISEIERISRDAANEAGATALYIAESLKAVADRCLQEVKPEMVWNGEERRMVETGDYVFNARDAVSALKTLSEIQGMKSEKLKIAGDKDDSLEINLKIVE